ncbi:MAG: flagellar basal body rod protein FlgC [Bacteroidetes bacterium]|nr:flagellar basal body rod protein FlgC [Bacteroidota bacterium]
MNIDRIFAGLNISAKGLTAQRKKMNAIASNIANAETTRTEEGGPYVRKVVHMSEQQGKDFASMVTKNSFQLEATNKNHFSFAAESGVDNGSLASGVEANEDVDASPFKMVYDPSHPDANEEGYVQMPNVNVVTEMVDMISATRSYEANVTAINASKSMAKDSLEI